MGADASLVNMAYRAAAAKSPGDWSDSFNKSYEGLIASHKALTGAIGEGVTAAGKVGEAIEKRKKEDLEGVETTINIDDIYKNGKDINDLSTTTANKKNKNSSKKYESPNGSPSALGDYEAATNTMLNFKKGSKEDGNEGKGLEYYANKSFLTKKDKEKQAELQRKAQQFKEKLIQEKAQKRTLAGHYAANDVNLTKTYGGDGETAMVLSQILDPDADWKKLGIQSAWEDGKKIYYYTPNRLKAEYDANKSPLVSPPGSDLSTDAMTPIESYKADPNSVIRISAEDLYGGIVLKDKQTETANQTVIIDMEKAAKENDSFSGDGEGEIGGAFSVEQTTRHSFRQNFMNAEGGSREAVIDFWDRGLYGVDPSKDLKKGLNIATYKGLLGSKYKEMDWGGLDTDGVPGISEAEAKAGDLQQADIDNIYNQITNPKDDAEAKFSIDEASNYLTSLAKQQFDAKKAAQWKKDNPEPTWTQKRAKLLYERESLKNPNEITTSKFGLDLKKNYYTIQNAQGGASYIDGQTISNNVETFKAVQDAGSGTFSPYDNKVYLLENGKWTTYNASLNEEKGGWEPSNPKSIFNSLDWSNNPKIMEYLKIQKKENKGTPAPPNPNMIKELKALETKKGRYIRKEAPMRPEDYEKLVQDIKAKYQK